MFQNISRIDNLLCVRRRDKYSANMGHFRLRLYAYPMLHLARPNETITPPLSDAVLKTNSIRLI